MLRSSPRRAKFTKTAFSGLIRAIVLTTATFTMLLRGFIVSKSQTDTTRRWVMC